jgi:hypothetical protein
MCLLSYESSNDSELICHESNKAVIWLPYKILNHYNCTNYQKGTEANDGSG